MSKYLSSLRTLDHVIAPKGVSVHLPPDDKLDSLAFGQLGMEGLERLVAQGAQPYIWPKQDILERVSRQKLGICIDL